jgi:hypothetical protein
MKFLIRLILASLMVLGLQAQELAPETAAKFLKVLLSSSGQFGFACNDAALKAKLEADGLSVAPGFKMAWAASEAEVKSLKAAGKVVVVPKLAWLKLGGSIALVEEDGKPQLYIHPGNLKASGMTLSDAVVKMAKKAGS